MQNLTLKEELKIKKNKIEEAIKKKKERRIGILVKKIERAYLSKFTGDENFEVELIIHCLADDIRYSQSIKESLFESGIKVKGISQMSLPCDDFPLAYYLKLHVSLTREVKAMLCQQADQPVRRLSIY